MKRMINRRKRNGVATLWVILTLPLLVLMIAILLETGSTWTAKQQLQAATDAAALASAQQWSETGNEKLAIEAARQFAEANVVRGDALDFTKADSTSVTFGFFDGTSFYSTAELKRGESKHGEPAIMVRAKASFSPLFASFFGSVVGPMSVQSHSVVAIEPRDGSASLVIAKTSADQRN